MDLSKEKHYPEFPNTRRNFIKKNYEKKTINFSAFMIGFYDGSKISNTVQSTYIDVLYIDILIVHLH